MNTTHYIPSQKGDSPGQEAAPPLGCNIRLPQPMVTLAAFFLIIFLTGCVSTHMASYDDPYSYSPKTDCPLIGDPPDETSDLAFNPASKPALGSESPRIEPHAHGLGQQQSVFPRIDPHQY